MKILKYLAFILAIIACILFVAYFTLALSNTTLAKDIIRNLSSNIGDFTSGTIGIILAFVSTLFLFLTFNMQQDQNEDSKNDAFRTRFEGTFFNMLSMYYNVRSEADRQIELSSSDKMENMKGFYKGFKEFYNREVITNQSFAEEMNALAEDSICESQYRTAMYDLGNLYDQYVEYQGCNAGFYFRYVHNLITFVLNHWKGKDEEIHIYLNFIQAQMSDEELALVFYDCFSNKGLDKHRQYTFKHNLDKYSFLENLSESILLDRCHYKIFPNTVFRFLNDDEREKVEQGKLK